MGYHNPKCDFGAESSELGVLSQTGVDSAFVQDMLLQQKNLESIEERAIRNNYIATASSRTRALPSTSLGCTPNDGLDILTSAPKS